MCYLIVNPLLTQIRLARIPSIMANTSSRITHTGTIDFEQLDFGYTPSNVFMRNINIHIPDGSMVAIEVLQLVINLGEPYHARFTIL